MNIILASGSPRRKELMTLAGIDFEVIPSKAKEYIPENCTPEKAVVHLATLKAQNISDKYTDSVVIGADTIVVNNGEILGKPKNKNDAFNMLKSLSGKSHSVFTGVCIIKNGKTETFYEETKVTFYPLTDNEINTYISTDEPMDKAGAYGIQGKGCVLVKAIEGDYFNVVGLPIARLKRILFNDII